MTEVEDNRRPTAQPDLLELKKITTVVYALQAASFLFGVTLIVAIILNYIKKEDVHGTWLESHFRWQIRTFWVALLLGIIGALTIIVAIGFAILAFLGIWLIYRVLKGWLRLSEGKEMYPAAKT